jgi:hypothetical protein
MEAKAFIELGELAMAALYECDTSQQYQQELNYFMRLHDKDFFPSRCNARACVLVIFNRANGSIFLQVIRMATH